MIAHDYCCTPRPVAINSCMPQLQKCNVFFERFLAVFVFSVNFCFVKVFNYVERQLMVVMM